MAAVAEVQMAIDQSGDDRVLQRVDVFDRSSVGSWTASSGVTDSTLWPRTSTAIRRLGGAPVPSMSMPASISSTRP